MSRFLNNTFKSITKDMPRIHLLWSIMIGLIFAYLSGYFISTSYLLILLMFLLGVTIYAFVYHKFFSTYSMKICIGANKKFEKIDTKADNQYRTIFIAIQNTGNKPLSNCEAQLKFTGSKGEPKVGILGHNFSLYPREKKFIRIASYNEAKKEDKIKLYFLIGALAPDDIFIPSSHEHYIKLSATSLEASACEIDCKLRVDLTDGKLKLSKIT